MLSCSFMSTHRQKHPANGHRHHSTDICRLEMGNLKVIETGQCSHSYRVSEEPWYLRARAKDRMTFNQATKCLWSLDLTVFLDFSVLRRTSSIFIPMNSFSCKVGVFDDSVIDDIDDKIWSLHGIFLKYLCHFVPNRNIPCLLHRTSNLIQKTGGKNKLGGLQENSATLSASDHSYVKISILSIHFPSDMPNIQHDLNMDDISYLKRNLKSILMVRTKKKLLEHSIVQFVKTTVETFCLRIYFGGDPFGHITFHQFK